MKSFYNRNDRFIIVYLLPWLCLTVIFFYSCSAGETDHAVRQAHQLRLEGRADSAKTILEKCLSEDSTNAALWFELARTQHHIGLGNPRAFLSDFPSLQRSIQKAVALEPDNIIYAYYHCNISFTNAYISLMRDPGAAKEKVQLVYSAYQSLLDLKPDYKEAMLSLVEACSLPENMGGDPEMGREYADKLMSIDPVFGAKAEELLLPEEADRVNFWQETLAGNPDNPDFIEHLAKAHLHRGDTETGEQLIEQALEKGSKNDFLLLDLARFYIMKSRQDNDAAKNVLPKADKAISRYLQTEPALPFKAFALNMQAGINFSLGLTEKGQSLQTQATDLDPNVSKAFGIPSALLFDNPDEISHYHGYFFRPF